MAASGCQNVALPPAWRGRADRLRVTIQEVNREFRPERGMPSRRGLLLMALRRGLYRLEGGLQDVAVVEAPYSDRFSLLTPPNQLLRANRLRVRLGLLAGTREILSRRVVVLTSVNLGLTEIERIYAASTTSAPAGGNHEDLAL